MFYFLVMKVILSVKYAINEFNSCFITVNRAIIKRKTNNDFAWQTVLKTQKVYSILLRQIIESKKLNR